MEPTRSLVKQPSHPSRVRHPGQALRRRQVLPRWVRRIDRAAAKRVNSRHAHPHIDSGYRRLSNSANRGGLWFTLAAVLMLFGWVRPAVRGVASLTVASILANLLGKRLFGGDRPLLKDVPFGRHLGQQPTSASFPSGHSASAAAFATGVALEKPSAGAAVAPIALGVAYSRLHTGAHWLSDVIGGVTIGAAVAALGKLMLPARLRERRRAAGIPVELPALPRGEGLVILVNTTSGVGFWHPNPQAISKRLPGAEVRALEADEDPTEVARAALRAPQGDRPSPAALGVCGGDGTVAAVARVAREYGLPLVVMPGGTFNHFARTAGDESIEDAAKALEAGTGFRVDIADLAFGTSEPATVLNAASVGLYPDFVAERDRLRKRVGKWLAGFVAAIRVLAVAEPVEVKVNSRVAQVWSLFVGVNRNSPAAPVLLRRRRLVGGVLDVRILHATSRASAVASLTFGRRGRPLEVFTTESLTVEVRPHGGQPPGFAHDGEVSLAPRDGARDGRYVSRILIVPGGLDVYSPR